MLWRQYGQKKNLHHSNCAQNKAKQTTRSSLQNRNKKKRKGEKNCRSIRILEIKRNQLRSVITHPEYVMWLTICIDLITKVKSLRRKLNLFKYTLCFAFFKTIQNIYFTFFHKFENSFAKCKMQSANSNLEKGLYSPKNGHHLFL